MLSHIFLGMSLIGAEWVLYLLLLLSIFSVALMVERARFYRLVSKGSEEFRSKIRTAAASGQLEEALRAAQERSRSISGAGADPETAVAAAMLSSHSRSPEVLSEIAQDAAVRARLQWERNLALLATIGSNAPFIGLFGTVLGIIKAFHDLSQQQAAGVQMVTSGVSEALVATAVGILVAIPAVVAFNLFQRRVKSALAEAEALKSFLIGKLHGR